MEISRDSERNEQQVVQGFPEDRHGHSSREREPNKRKDGTFHDGVYDAPTSTARVGVLLCSHFGDWIIPMGPGMTPTVH